MSKAKVEVIAGYKIHPVASLFPLMGKKELAELAASIKANGQREPIMGVGDVNGENYLIADGRNRLLACEAAGVEPWVTDLTGLDPVAYIIDKNLRRRHMTDKQRAAFAADLTSVSIETGSETPAKALTVTEAAEAMEVTPIAVKRARKTAKTDPEAHAAAKAGKKRKAKPEKKSMMSARQEAWSDIVRAVNRLYKAFQAAHLLDDAGDMTEADADKLVKDGRGVTSKPEVFAATLAAVRRAVHSLNPIVGEAYKGKK